MIIRKGKKIGANIYFYRRINDCPRRNLADSCGVDEVTLYKYEMGKLTPDPETMQRIASALGVTCQDLME